MYEVNRVREERENNSYHLGRENTKKRKEKVAEQWLELLYNTHDVIGCSPQWDTIVFKNWKWHIMFSTLIKEFT